jgi:hypothetical protein
MRQETQQRISQTCSNFFSTFLAFAPALALLLTLALLLSACSKIDPVGAQEGLVETTPFRSLTPPTVGRFELETEENLILEDIQFLIWREPVPSKETVAEVIRLSQLVDEANAKAAPWVTKIGELEDAHRGLFSRSRSLSKRIGALTQAVADINLRIHGFQTLIREKQAEFYELSVAAQPDTQRLLEIRSEIDALRTKIREQEVVKQTRLQELGRFEAQQAELEPRVKSAQAEITRYQALLKPWDESGQKQVSRIAELTHWPKARPTRLVIEPRVGGGVEALTLEGWDLGDDRQAVNYSSRSDAAHANLIDLNYAPEGGKLSFSLCIHPKLEDSGEFDTSILLAAYRVEMVRADYERPDRFLFQGDLIRNVPRPGEESWITCAELARRRTIGESYFGLAKAQKAWPASDPDESTEVARP